MFARKLFVILSYKSKMYMIKSEIQQVKLRFGIIGNAEALNRAIDIAIQVAPTDLSVLITGESGVEKKVSLRLYINIAGENMDNILP